MRIVIIGLLLLVASCYAIKITDPKFSFSSQIVETHLVIKQDPNRAANEGIELTVALSGTNAPTVKPEEVLSVVGGSVEVKAVDIASTSTSPITTTGPMSAGSRIHSSSMLLPILLGLFGALAGVRFRFAGVLAVSIALLMGSSIGLKQFESSWKLTVTATIPPSMSLTSLDINILRGSLTMVNGALSVSSSVNVDLCDNNGNGDSNFINLDAASLTLPAKTSTFCATKKVILQNAVVPKGANLQVTSLQDSGYVFVKDTYAGVFSASSKDGFAITTACENKTMTQAETTAMKGSCGVALINGTASTSEARVSVSGLYDAVFAVAEGISTTLQAAKRWSDAATWGGQVPQNGSNVMIASNQVILLDTKTASLGDVVIHGVLIADPQTDFWLTANSVSVYGTLRVGSVYEPYARKGGFTLTGAKGNYTSRAPLLAFSNNATSRAILGYPNCKVMLYGSLPRRTYTRLNDHASQNSTLLTVDSVDGWQVGDMIAISPTTSPQTSSTDKRKIVAINAQTRQVTIDQGLSYARWGKLQYATDQGISLTPGVFKTMRPHPDIPDTIDERAVIVHLTRNIVINAPNDSDWQAGHGVHFMWMGPRTQVQLSGVEVHRAGQAGALGRYPLHAHMQSYNMEGATSFTSISDGKFVGDAIGVFVRNCAVHNSVNRAYTLHGTCGARFENNVAYDIVGHAYFFEDGSEMRNLFVGNVVLNVRRPDDWLRLIRSDEFSSGFWYTNGNNYFRNNIAGDIRIGNGIWNAFSTRPDPTYVVVSKPDSITFTCYINKFEVLLETWTLTNANATHWSVVGSVSGQSTMAAAGQDYANGIVRFKFDGSAAIGATIVFRIEGYAGGCFGQSRNVPIWPEYLPMLDYNNNTAFACFLSGVTTDNSATDELGSTFGSRKFISTIGGVPTQDDHNSPLRVPTQFNGTRLWMNAGGGYTNRVYNPLYSRWIASNNFGNDLSGSTQNGRFENGLVVGNSLNRLDPDLYNGPRHAFATYHFSIEFFNISFFNYPANTQPFKTVHGLLDMNGVIQSWDLYLNSLEVGPRGKLIGWKLFNCSQFERTPPANIELTYANSSGGPDVMNRYWTLSGAMHDADGTLAGRAGDYLVFDVPYFTYNLPGMRRVTPTSHTIATTGTFYGIGPSVADGQRADYAPITFARLNDQTLAEEGTWVIGDGDKSVFFKYMRHASIMKGAIYNIYNHVNRTPNRNKYEVIIYNPDSQFNTSVVVGMPWAGDVPAKVLVWGSPAVTQVASFALMRSTPLSYFQDTTANIVWHHHHVQGNACPVTIVPQ